MLKALESVFFASSQNLYCHYLDNILLDIVLSEC